MVISSTHTIQVRRDLAHPCMDVMNFLNEAADRYPRAISFAAGRPPDRFVSAERTGQWIARYVRERTQSCAIPEQSVWRELGQYGPAAGIVRDLVARWLAEDEDLHPEPGQLVITNGMQEAVFLLLSCICDGPDDVVLSDAPSYVGFAGAALLARVPAIPVDGSEPLLTRLERALAAIAAQKRRARALYLVPDFSNPTGATLTLAERQGLLEIAREQHLLLIEDTAYRAFRYQGDELPTLKALDTEGLVVQVGSFSKLFMPGPRFGYLYADQRVSQEDRRTLAEEVAKAKSFVSVLTSPLVQATVGGFLLEQQFTLRSWNRPRIELCKASRDTLLEALDQEVGADLRDHVRWSRPEGGFFLTFTLPFEFGHHHMLTCARDYGLIACPLSYFSAAPEHTKTARLSFSNLTHDDAREGAKRWTRFVREELARRGTRATPRP